MWPTTLQHTFPLPAANDYVTEMSSFCCYCQDVIRHILWIYLKLGSWIHEYMVMGKVLEESKFYCLKCKYATAYDYCHCHHYSLFLWIYLVFGGSSEEQAFLYNFLNITSRFTSSKYEGVLISPQPDLLPDVVGRNRYCRWKEGVCSCAELQVFSCYRGWKEA